MQLQNLIVLPTLASSFAIRPEGSQPYFSRLNVASNDDNKDEGLVFNDLDKAMGKVSSDYSFVGGIDYLAEARKRAEKRVQSNNEGAGDAGWQELAKEKEEKFGKIDDWENSKKEAGNSDSQILLFTEPTPSEDEEGDGEEPKLLLF